MDAYLYWIKLAGWLVLYFVITGIVAFFTYRGALQMDGKIAPRRWLAVRDAITASISWPLLVIVAVCGFIVGVIAWIIAKIFGLIFDKRN